MGYDKLCPHYVWVHKNYISPTIQQDVSDRDYISLTFEAES